MAVMGPELLGRLLDTRAAALTLYARQWCAAPEDVVQEAFVRLAALHSPPDDPVAWLYRAVRNGAISAGRSDRRRRRHESAAASAEWFLPAEGAALDGGTAAAAVEALPPDEREVVVAHLWGGLKFEQIAAITGVSSSTAHRRYQAALAALRERLKVSCPTHAKRPV
jgi:RNA polymerase sigma-70 factor (ECF subfamily)